MNAENAPKLAIAMNYIADDLISGAMDYAPAPKRAKHLWLRRAVLAACLCLAVFAVLRVWHTKPSTRPLPPLEIPMEQSASPTLRYSIELDTVDLPTTAELFQFVDAPADVEEVIAELARIFGFSAEAEAKDFGDFILLEEGGKLIDYEPDTGAWSFYDMAYDKTAPHSLPSEEEAVTIARTFLEKTGLYNERFSTEKVVTQYAGNEADGTYAPWCRTVYFCPTVNGAPILGVSRMVVGVGEGEGIIELLKYYRDFVSCGEIELASPLSFVEGIQENRYSTGINPEAVSASITEVSLAYWEDARQPWLQPVWVFQGTALLPNGTEEPFDIIVQAAKNVADAE